MSVDIIILFTFIMAALWTVMTRSLLRSAIGLALTSAILSIIMFRLNSPLAAVFELSVCSGLISVLFISTISLTHPLTQKEVLEHMRERLARFWLLPFIVIVLGITLSLIDIRPVIKLPLPETVKDVRVVLWNLRQVDVMGQIIILLTGVFGVVILFKERVKK
ncbi:MAG: NADH-quinone oxidoreductase subunit J [Candidatus Omnitrophica bacterium]|nr:NADH-quinone oxidoreductase subunit J [Candidatus Omnitrophota bacterium]MDD5352098.1 NADH-quinone oxidoreductase subunit J [Candidatus Omnitrophota bacterium]MDD5549696.1 NADH-quinone oxidoreductase subunit J [Candidatus Omnitrophota bacterium]